MQLSWYAIRKKIPLKQCKTNRLFYNTYLYKISVRNSLCAIFRDKKLPYARKILDEYQTQLETSGKILEDRGRITREIPISTLSHAQFLYNELASQNQNDYKLRIESPIVGIYTNDKYWVKSLELRLDDIVEIWKPSPDLESLLAPNIIISDQPIDFEYKVTVGNEVNSSFAVWARDNPTKVKAGIKFLDLVENNQYVNGMYFYVRDLKILQFINIIVGGPFRRVDKFINKPDIDK